MPSALNSCLYQLSCGKIGLVCLGSQNIRVATTLSEDLAVASRALIFHSSWFFRRRAGGAAAAGESPKETRLVLIFLSLSYWLGLFFSPYRPQAEQRVLSLELSLYIVFTLRNQLSRGFFSLPYQSPASFLTQISEANERMTLIMMSVDSLKIHLSVIAIVLSFLKKFSLKVVVIQLTQTTWQWGFPCTVTLLIALTS